MRKGQTATDTPIILTIVVFNAFIILSLGFLNINNSDSIKTQTYGSGLINFSQNIVTNISLLGWGNALLFTPLVVCIVNLTV